MSTFGRPVLSPVLLSWLGTAEENPRKAEGGEVTLRSQGLHGYLGFSHEPHAPKFRLNATPQGYDSEVGSPGWTFFYSNEALPDHRLGA
jgi:hypothetical protein